VFFNIRIVLGLACALAEAYFFRTILARYGGEKSLLAFVAFADLRSSGC
jgi:hypothetical protein